MGRHNALVIHDDPEIVDEVAEILTSLGLEHDWVRSQQEARESIRANAHSCILLDPNIPARPKGGARRIQNGVNLLEEAVASPGGAPVIVMLGRSLMSMRKEVEFAVALMRKGAADVIRKPPIEGGRTLDKAIKSALAKRCALQAAPPSSAPAASPAPIHFQGGEMRFFHDHVELCDMKIIGNTGVGQMRRILEVLAKPDPGGGHVAMSGTRLAKAVGADGGQNAVAGCVRNFRKGVVRALAERGITCGLQDVIQSGGQGYRLRDWITVRHIGQAAGARAEAAR